MRILVLNQYFHPDLASTGQLLTELCEDLSNEHQITVVAGHPSYNAGGSSDTARRGGFVSEGRHGDVRVLRTWSTSFPRERGIPGRLANYASYLASCLAGAMKATRPDVVLTMTDPPVVAAAAAAASAARRVPFVYVNQDIFPEVGVALGAIRNPAIVRGLGALNRGLRRRADRVVAIGRDMRERLIALGTPPERIAVIPNWSDGSLVRPLDAPSTVRAERGWDDRFVVMHSGNVGLSQDLETLLGAAELLRDVPSVLVAIVGEGASKERLRRIAAERRLDNVEFHPYQPKTTLAESLGAADLHVIGLRRGLAGYIVPSKLYGILAAGKPYVAAIEEDSEPAMVAAEHDCGLRVDPGDPEGLAQAILVAQKEDLSAMGGRGRAALERLYDRPMASAAYESVLREAAVAGR